MLHVHTISTIFDQWGSNRCSFCSKTIGGSYIFHFNFFSLPLVDNIKDKQTHRNAQRRTRTHSHRQVKRLRQTPRTTSLPIIYLNRWIFKSSNNYAFVESASSAAETKAWISFWVCCENTRSHGWIDLTPPWPLQ